MKLLGDGNGSIAKQCDATHIFFDQQTCNNWTSTPGRLQGCLNLQDEPEMSRRDTYTAYT